MREVMKSASAAEDDDVDDESRCVFLGNVRITPEREREQKCWSEKE